MSHSQEEFTIGEDLYGVSIKELKDRRAILQAEIERIEVFLVSKEKEMQAAENIFRS